MHLFFFLLVMIGCHISANNTTYIIVHGTWAKAEEWYQDGGDFFDTLYSVTDNSDTITSFVWSGSCFESARTMAAHHLALVIESTKTEKLVVIAHSHGGNVALKAAEFLSLYKLSKTIDILILFGTPHYHTFSFPNSIEFIFNFFSFGDQIQPIFNLFRRDIPKNDRTANIAISIQGHEPTHEQLHHPLIAFHIPDIVKMESEFRTHICQKPHAISLAYGKPMHFKEDYERHARMVADIAFQERLPAYLLWGPTEPIYFL